VAKQARRDAPVLGPAEPIAGAFDMAQPDRQIGLEIGIVH
jgi:hypothetical protein